MKHFDSQRLRNLRNIATELQQKEQEERIKFALWIDRNPAHEVRQKDVPCWASVPTSVEPSSPEPPEESTVKGDGEGEGEGGDVGQKCELTKAIRGCTKETLEGLSILGKKHQCSKEIVRFVDTEVRITTPLDIDDSFQEKLENNNKTTHAWRLLFGRPPPKDRPSDGNSYPSLPSLDQSLTLLSDTSTCEESDQTQQPDVALLRWGSLVTQPLPTNEETGDEASFCSALTSIHDEVSTAHPDRIYPYAADTSTISATTTSSPGRTRSATMTLLWTVLLLLLLFPEHFELPQLPVSLTSLARNPYLSRFLPISSETPKASDLQLIERVPMQAMTESRPTMIATIPVCVEEPRQIVSSARPLPTAPWILSRLDTVGTTASEEKVTHSEEAELVEKKASEYLAVTSVNSPYDPTRAEADEAWMHLPVPYQHRQRQRAASCRFWCRWTRRLSKLGRKSRRKRKTPHS